jgi:bacterioferritin (cytochrome b1)
MARTPLATFSNIPNKALTNELTAINQYFIHSEMCEHWGTKLNARIKQQTT